MLGHQQRSQLQTQLSVLVPGRHKRSGRNRPAVERHHRHGRPGQGLRKAIYNYMHGLCVEDDVRRWFEHMPMPVPRATVKRGRIRKALTQLA